MSDDAEPFACYSKHRTDRHEYFESIHCKQMHPKKKIEKVIDKYYLYGVRIGCAVVRECLSEFRELSLSNYLGLVQTYALAYAYVLGRGRPDGFFPDFAVRGQLWKLC